MGKLPRALHMTSLASDTTLPDEGRPPRLGSFGLHAVLLGIVTLVGLLLRVPSFSDSLNGDELATYFVVTEHGIGRIIDIVQGDQEVTPPLYLILARLTQGIGDPIDSLRWVPMISGIACIPLTYALGVRTLDRRAAIVAATVVALSPFLIFYSSEARAYGLVMLLTLGSTLALLRAVDGPRRGWWAAYAVLSCAAMYTHYTAAFVLAGQAAWALVYHRRDWRWLLGANAAAAIGWAPWLSSYRADQSSPGADLIGILQPFNLSALKTDLLHWSISHPLTGFSVRDMPGETALLLLGLGLAIGAGGTVIEARRRGKRIRLPDEGSALVLILGLSSPVIAAIYSAVEVSVFLPRNMISSSPGLALVFALVVTRARSPRIWVPATTLLLAGFAIGGVRMVSTESQRTDYKGVAAFIADRGGPRAVTVDSPGMSPGALSQLDAPAAPGEAAPRTPTILRLGRPTRPAQLRAGRPGGPGQFAPLPIPSPKAIARQAMRLSGGREIFLVNLGGFSLSELRGEAAPITPGSREALRRELVRAATVGTPVASFLQALPRSYRATETRTFPGFFGISPVSVYVLRREDDDGR